MPFTLTSIHIYPIKSMGGISVKEADLSDRGLKYDRRWMLVRPDGRFLTQRQLPQMVWLEVQIRGGRMWVRHRRHEIEPLEIPLVPKEGKAIQVEIFKDSCIAWKVDKGVDEWFSGVLGTACHLVYMPDESERLIEQDYRRKAGEKVSFADGYPCLIIGQASLDQLNRRLEIPIEMERFRPNFVFAGGEAHAEDNWSAIRIGNTLFQAVKKCARCQIPTVDPELAVFRKEPTRTLSAYRKTGNKVYFGMNLLLNGTGGKVKVGDLIELS